ncbi:MAG: glycosyltransferase family 39 protein [bacterium]|nr:glycosyltransferase family 39 protein [bacterium]
MQTNSSPQRGPMATGGGAKPAAAAKPAPDSAESLSAAQAGGVERESAAPGELIAGDSIPFNAVAPTRADAGESGATAAVRDAAGPAAADDQAFEFRGTPSELDQAAEEIEAAPREKGLLARGVGDASTPAPGAAGPMDGSAEFTAVAARWEDEKPGGESEPRGSLKTTKSEPARPARTGKAGAPAGGTPSGGTPADAASAVVPFEIVGFDEERPPEQGRIFAEPLPEPPPQPFEIVRQPHPSRIRIDFSPAANPPAATDWGAHEERPAMAPSVAAARPAVSPPPLVVRFFWGFMPLILLLVGYGSVVLTQKGMGYAWDEAYYYEPALKAADWLVEVLRGNNVFDRAAIDVYWGERHEHPSIQKLLSGIAMRAFSAPKNQLWAMRLPMAILFGLSLNLIYLMGRRAWGPVPGLAAALVYATMPRVFGHAHFASLETPLIFMSLQPVCGFQRGLDSPLWAAFTGIAFGLLLATKINGFFLPVPLVIWAHLYARRRYVNNLFAMLTLGPVFMVLAWPWLWPDPVVRLLEYLRFHAEHQQTALFFLGRKWGYGGANAPWFYPLTMVAVTIPVGALALLVLGLAKVLHRPHRQPMGALFLCCAAVMLTVASLPSTPRYDGVRLFLPVFPFLALLCGAGTVEMMSLTERAARRLGVADPVRLRRLWRWTASAIVAVVLLEGVAALVRYHPYTLSYFNALAGGIRGAERRGFEVTYWGEALNEDVLTAINELPDGSSLDPLAIHELCLQHLQEWGLIKEEIRIGGRPPYDYHLLLMRRGFFTRPEMALAGRTIFPVVREWRLMGVPLIALYKTGPPFEKFWPTLPPLQH